MRSDPIGPAGHERVKGGGKTLTDDPGASVGRDKPMLWGQKR